MPLERRAMGRDDFALRDVHALLIERQQFELAAVRPLHEGADNDGRRSGVRVNRPVSKAQ